MNKQNFYDKLGIMFVLIGAGLMIGLMFGVADNGICIFNCY